MKKRALSMVSYILCAVILLTGLAIPVVATESTAMGASDSLKDYLIVHYDFEETDTKTALQNPEVIKAYIGG